jgi:Carboxypeptidase regulatory-like domain/TonB-dependent Receptor Plug Domain
MNSRFSAKIFMSSLLVCFAVLFLCVSVSLAQSGTSGALTGTVTDPSGAVISGATVAATNNGTGQERDATTDASGTYKFSLLPPGSYKVKFAASGFKTSEVAAVTVNATETAVLNQNLAVGAQSEQITVESTAERLQTQNATMGTLVGAKTVTDLPLSSRNYTQIIDLSPGVVANVASAAAVGNGTQDINVNGSGSDQNNYMMDGASVTNYGSGGGAQSGNFPGIGIPNPDSIQEFKIQTSQYDAEYGRNPGASVNVVTRGGTNSFHGAAWEFFRNSALDGNDFFNKNSELTLDEPNKPEILNENMFGGTIGGPIKKDKLFFFGSYQGFRQKNGVGTNGFATGLAAGVQLPPWNEPNGTRADTPGLTVPLNLVAGAPACDASTYRMYLGCVFANNVGLVGLLEGPNAQLGTGVPVAMNGSNINQVAINMLQLPGPKGVNGGFYFPSIPFGSNGLPVTQAPVTISQAIQANEDQYLGNADWVISSKNTLSERFFTSKDPQIQPFVCLGFVGAPGVNNCQPGAPESVTYTADSGVLKLTTVVTSNFVNEALFSVQRSTTVASPDNYHTACSVGIIPPIANGDCASLSSIKGLNPIPAQLPTIGVFALPTINLAGGGVVTPGAWNNGGNFFASATNFFNTFQYKDQISWNHGKHAIRAGAEADRIQYNWTLPGRGGLAFPTIADFLTSSSGGPNAGTPAAPGGILANFYGYSSPIGNPHYQRTNEFSAFAEDDIKLSRKLTVNLGIRWEYDGWPSDITGLFSNGSPQQAALVNTGSFFLGDQVTCAAFPCATPNNTIGTLVGYTVQSNYNPNLPRCGTAPVPAPCGLSAPVGVYGGYPGGATGVLFNSNKTLIQGSPLANFGPRIGIAWQPLGDRFVVRAGYGVFYDAVYANLLANNNAGNAPYSGAVPAVPANSLDLPGPTNLLFGWLPRTLGVTAGTAATGATAIAANEGGEGVGTTSDSPTMTTPLIQQYNLDLQYEFAKNWIIDAGYVGTHGTKLYDWARPINIGFLAPGAPNEPTDPQNARMIVGSGAPGTLAALPFNDVNNTNPATQVLENTEANAPGRVSYLGYAPTGLSTTDTIGDSLYDSLQVGLRHQFSNGLLLQASYTWSKLMTNVNGNEGGSGIAAPGNVLSGGASSNDPLDFGQQYGLAAFNRPQRLVVAYSYELPFTKHTEGLVGKALSGWQISGVTTIQDGEPFTVVDGTGGTIYYGAGGAGFGGNGVRAELGPSATGPCNSVGVCKTVGGASTGSNYQRVVSGIGTAAGVGGWINTAAYGAFGPAGYAQFGPPCIGGTPNPGGSPLDACGAAPNPITGDPGAPFVGGGVGFGNSGVGAIMGPGQFNWDFSIIKNTKVTEGTSVQFRAEFYNLWNHPQFNPPVDDASTAFFGKIFSSSVPPRILQFALKYTF